LKLLLIVVVVDVKFVNHETLSDWLALRDNKFVDWVVETLFKHVDKPVISLFKFVNPEIRSTW
jgi:hypothetical protein